jgi:hypothetical protein
MDLYFRQVWILVGQIILLAFANLCCSQALHPIRQVIVVLSWTYVRYILCVFVMMLVCTVHHAPGWCYHFMHPDF